jgi:hypothetical protein
VFEKSEKLSNDVGKTVKITGHLMNPNENSENSSANANANMNQPKDITVSHYTVVSQSCK